MPLLRQFRVSLKSVGKRSFLAPSVCLSVSLNMPHVSLSQTYPHIRQKSGIPPHTYTHIRHRKLASMLAPERQSGAAFTSATTIKNSPPMSLVPSSSSSFSSSSALPPTAPASYHAEASSLPTTAPASYHAEVSSALAMLQTDAVIVSLYSLLYASEKLRLSEVCKTLLLYGPGLKHATVTWPDTPSELALVSPADLLNFLRRQEHMTSIYLRWSQDMLPHIFTPLPSFGHFQHLEKLFVEQTFECLGPSSIATLADAIARGGLPSLKKLMMQTVLQQGCIRLLLEALRGGASPGLHTLQMDYKNSFYVYDAALQTSTDFLTREEKDKEAELDLTTTIAVLEERKLLGTCAGLKRFEGCMGGRGPAELKPRLLRLLLPSLEVLPHDLEWTDELAAVLEDVGAPSLKNLGLRSRVFPALVEGMASMGSLETLFMTNALDGPAVDAFISVLQRYRHTFLPNLKTMTLKTRSFMSVGADAGRFFRAVGETKAFPSVKFFCLTEDDQTNQEHWHAAITIFAQALGQGGFSGLEKLKTGNVWVGGPDFPKFVQALEAAPCARNLKLLCMQCADITVKNARLLADLIARRFLPSLLELDIGWSGEMGNRGACAVIRALTTAESRVEKLRIGLVGLGNKAVKVLAEEMAKGGLRNLVELDLWGNKDLTNKGMIDSLAPAMKAGYLSKLRLMTLHDSGVQTAGCVAVCEAMVGNCVDLKELLLPDTIKREDQLKVLGVPGVMDYIKKKGLRLEFY